MQTDVFAAEFTISESTGGSGTNDITVLAFTSDVHNDQSNYTGQTRLGKWTDNIKSQYGKIDVMAFGGDSGGSSGSGGDSGGSSGSGGGSGADTGLTEFNNHKSEVKTAVEKLAEEGDSVASAALIANAKTAIEALQYDSSKTPEENKAAIDSIISDLETALEAQRAADMKEAEDTAAVNAVTEIIGTLPSADSVTLGDKIVIEKARAAYDALGEDLKSKIPEDILKALTDAEAALQAAVEEA